MLNAGRVYRKRHDRRDLEHVVAGRDHHRETGPLPVGLRLCRDNARAAMDLIYRHGAARRSEARQPPGGVWRDLHVVDQTVTIAPDGTPSAAGCTWHDPGRVCTSHNAWSDRRRAPRQPTADRQSSAHHRLYHRAQVLMGVAAAECLHQPGIAGPEHLLAPSLTPISTSPRKWIISRPSVSGGSPWSAARKTRVSRPARHVSTPGRMAKGI